MLVQTIFKSRPAYSLISAGRKLSAEVPTMNPGATGPDLYRCFVFPTDLPEDKFVTAYEVRPGARQAVHHTLHFLDLQKRGRKLEEKEKSRPRRPEEKDFGPGYTMRMLPGFLPDGDVGGWAPGI